MEYIFESKNRYHFVKDYNVLVSKGVMFGLLMSVVVMLGTTLTVVFISTQYWAIGLTIMAMSILLVFLNVLFFAVTYFPWIKPLYQVKDLVKRKNQTPSSNNVAQAASFELLRALGPGAINNDKNGLLKSVESLMTCSYIDFFMKRLMIDRIKLAEGIRKKVSPVLTWPDFADRMLKVADKVKQPYVEPEHALGALLMHPAFKVSLRNVSLTEEDVLFVLWWSAENRSRRLKQKRWWDEERMLATSGVGMSWASGFTPFVDKFTRIPHGSAWDDILYGHETKVQELINTLARERQSNVLLVGDPGVGRIGIIRQLARQIRNNQAHRALYGERVLYMNVGELIAQGTSGAGQLAMVSRALNEMEKSGNVITVIDGLSSVLGREGEQRVNLTDILMPFLSSKNVRVVVITSAEEYHLRLKSNEELINYFEVVMVPSLIESDAMKRVALTVPVVERQSKLFIPYKSIKTLIEDTASIMPHIPYPERAYDFLEESVVLAQNENAKTLEPGHIQRLISNKLGINLGTMSGREKKQLLSLDKLMHRRLVNQEMAVNTLTHALIRARAQVRSKKRPIGTFLFLGPTGVGKTETTKTLAEVYFGSEDYMIRLDMSEFQGADGVARLIGDARNPVGRLTSLVSDHPYSVVLLDEFEKATAQVHQLFLQVFDEGHLTDASGRKFSFLHTIIVATSNAGSEMIRQSMQNGVAPEGFEEILKNHILSENIFRPELLNRFDAVVTYSPLSMDHIKQIAVLMMNSLNRRLDAEHGVTVAITDELLNFLIEIGYDPEFGARPMTRAIQNSVEYVMAQKILRGEVQPGKKITLSEPILRAAIVKS